MIASAVTRKMKMKRKRQSRFIGTILLGLAIMIPAFSGNLAIAQTTTTLTYESTSIDSFARKPKPKPVPVPEPASLILLGAGLAGLGIWRRVSRKD
jgi:PEP-CTERM motif